MDTLGAPSAAARRQPFVPLGLHETVTRGAVGEQAAQRLHAWSAFETARSELDRAGTRAARPEVGVPQAEARLGVTRAELRVRSAEADLRGLGIDPEVVAESSLARGTGQVPADVRRFERRFGKLDEQAARELWATASEITRRHNPFELTISEGAGSLLQRDPEQYWSTMQVAHALHEFADAPDRMSRAVAVAQGLAEERGLSAAREGLAGGAGEGVQEVALELPGTSGLRVQVDGSGSAPRLVDGARRYHVAALDGRLAGRFPGGFSLTDLTTTNRYHFDAAGTLVESELRLERHLGTLRLTGGRADQGVELVDSSGDPLFGLTPEALPDGRVALQPSTHADRPLERLVVDPADGRVVEETVAVPGERGELLGEYWKLDHPSRTAVRMDASGSELTGPWDQATLRVMPGGTRQLLIGDRVVHVVPDRLAAAVNRSVNVDAIVPRPVWRESENPLFRFDDRSPSTVFGRGFEPWYHENTWLWDYVEHNTRSAFVSTTVDPELGWGSAFKYEIRAPGGIEVNRTIPDNTFADELEISFPGGVHSRFVKGAWKQTRANDGALMEEWIPNPGFDPGDLNAYVAHAPAAFWDDAGDAARYARTPEPMAVTVTVRPEDVTGTVRPVVRMTEQPLPGLEHLGDVRLRLTEIPHTPVSAASSRLELVDAAGRPVPGRTVAPQESGGFTITGGPEGSLHFGPDGRFDHRELPLPGTDHTVRLDTPSGTDGAARLTDGDGLPVGTGTEVYRDADGLTVRLWLGGTPDQAPAVWRFDTAGMLHRHELPLTGLHGPDGLRVAVDHVPGTAGAPAVRTVELVGPSGLTGSLTVRPLEGELAARLPGGFSVTDSVTGTRTYFGADARAVSVEETAAAPVDDISEAAARPENIMGTEGLDLTEDLSLMWERTMEEAAGFHGPALAPEADLSAAESVMELLHRTGETADGATEPIGILAAEELAARARADMHALGMDALELRADIRELRYSAFDTMLGDARRTLRDHLDGGPAADGFTVAPLPDGGHAVVHDATGLRLEFEAGADLGARSGVFQIVHLGPEFGGGLRYREVLLLDAPDELAGLKVGATHGDDASYRVVGGDGRFTVGRTDDLLADDLRAEFAVTDTATGARYHFGPEGTLTYRDVPLEPLEGGLGRLRFDTGRADGAPGLVDAAGGPSAVPLRAEPLPDGRVALVPTSPDALPLERMVVDGRSGRLLEETTAARGADGEFGGEYWNIDHTTGTAVRTDASGRELSPRFDLTEPAPARPLDEDFGGPPAERFPLDSIPEESLQELTLSAPGLPGMRVHIAQAPEGGTLPEGAWEAELLDESGQAVPADRFAVLPVEGDLADRIPGGFSVVDHTTGARYHFAADGALHRSDIPLERNLGTVQLTEGRFGPTAKLVDADGNRIDAIRARTLRDGRVALGPATHADRPLENIVVDPARGRVVEETVAVPGERGDLLGEYWKLDHQAGTATRLDAHGFELSGRWDTGELRVMPNGEKHVVLDGNVVHVVPDRLAAAVDPAVTVDAVVPKPVWRDSEGPVFRYDDRSPSGIFERGFTPWDARNTDLADYVRHNSPSAFVSTTVDAELGWGKAYKYEMRAPGGIEVNQSIPDNIFANEREISFPGGVDPKFVKGAWKNAGSGDTFIEGEWIPNPHFDPRDPSALPGAGGGLLRRRDLALPQAGGELHIPASLDAEAVPRMLDRTGRPMEHITVTPLGDGTHVITSTAPHAQPLEGLRVAPDGSPLQETVAIRGRGGRPTGEYWAIDHTTGTAVRVDATGAPVGGGRRYLTAKVEPSGTGQFRLVADGTDEGVVLFERELLERGRVLQVDTDSAGRARWFEHDPADPAGAGTRHGSRVQDPDAATYHDTLTGNWLPGDFGDVRSYRRAADGGIVRAEQAPDGTWTWQRFDADGGQVLSGSRAWTADRTGFTDTYLDPVTGREAVAQQRTAMFPWSGLKTRRYTEHPLIADPAGGGLRADPARYQVFTHRNKEIESVELLADGSTLHIERITSNQLLPAFTWKGQAGGHWYDGFFSDFFDGDSKLAVSRFTETAPDGTVIHGVRQKSYGGTWRDVDSEGRLLRESRTLEDGRVIEVGRDPGDPAKWAPAPRPEPGRPYELHWHGDDGVSGTRYVEADGRTWRDVFTDTDGVERLSMRSEGEAVREYVLEHPPAGLDATDRSGVWVQKNRYGEIVARRDHWGGPDGGLYVEASGAPHRRSWTWEAYAADGSSAAPVATGKRISNRGSWSSPTWDDSFVDLDATGTAVRERNALETGEAWIDTTRQDDGSWTWQRFGADGRERSGGVREYQGAQDRWSDRIGDVEVRTREGGRVREYEYAVREETGLSPAARHPLHTIPEDAPAPEVLPEWATVTVDRGAWKEYDMGTAVRERAAVPGAPGRYRETDTRWGVWREYQDDHLVAQRTISGRVWQTDAFGRWSTADPAMLPEYRSLPGVDGVEVGLPGERGWRLVGRETDYRGAGAEFRGYRRQLRDVQMELWTGSRGGVALSMSRAELMSRRLTIDFTENFLISVSTSLVSSAALNDGQLTPQDFLKAMLTASIGGTVSGASTVLHEYTALGRFRTRLGMADSGYPRNWHNVSAEDTWSGEWTAWEYNTRWRGGTYDYGSGLVTGALGSFVANSVNAAVFGVDGTQLTGADALLAGGWGTAATVVSGVTTSVARTTWHNVAAGRMFHRGGLGDLAWNWTESLADRFTWHLLHTMGTGLGPSHAVPPADQPTTAAAPPPPVPDGAQSDPGTGR